MTLEDFEFWCQQHPEDFRPCAILDSERKFDTISTLPEAYKAFVERFGSLSVQGRTLMAPSAIHTARTFIRTFNQPEEGISFDHIIPFCNRHSNNWYFCFDGEKVVEFDPLDPFSIEHVVAESFEEFLDWLIQPENSVQHTLTLDGLLAGVTPDNMHEEIDFGSPTGKENL